MIQIISNHLSTIFNFEMNGVLLQYGFTIFVGGAFYHISKLYQIIDSRNARPLRTRLLKHRFGKMEFYGGGGEGEVFEIRWNT